MQISRIRSSKRLNVLVLTLALFCFMGVTGSEARADDDQSDSVQSIIEIGVDVILVRPLRFVSFLVGCVLYVPAVGMSFMDGKSSLEEAKEIFVIVPYETLFETALGDF